MKALKAYLVILFASVVGFAAGHRDLAVRIFGKLQC
jgi:hypothetical protein